MRGLRHGRTMVLAYAIVLLATAIPAAAWTPKAVKDDPVVFMPGTQPNTVQSFEQVGRCENCHSGYNQAVEPGSNWRGSMMAQSARDPLWLACLTVSAQDSIWAIGNPNATDICIRCHSPQGWLEGASDPTNTSKLTGGQLDGVHCDFCHRKIDPFTAQGQPDVPAEVPGSTASQLAAKTHSTNIADLRLVRLFDGTPFLNSSTLLPTWFGAFPAYMETGAGQYFVASSSGPKYGPFWDADARHQWNYSRYHKSREFCHACHDVSNPILENALADSSGSTKFAAASYFHVERTSSEFLLSAYGRGSGASSVIAGVPHAAKCQDCHMRDVTGAGANKAGLLIRPDQPLHDLTGGNVWMSRILASVDSAWTGYDAYNQRILSGQKYPGASIQVSGLSGQGSNLDRGSKRAMDQLKMAATLTQEAETASSLTLRVRNNTGHKLLSGFPEGRRMFLSVTFYDSAGNVLREVNKYEPMVSVANPNGTDQFVSGAVIDPATKNGELIWEAEMSSSLTGEAKTFHFALADGRHKDNRIPPKGFDKTASIARKAEPVWNGQPMLDYFSDTEYLGGYDDVTIAKPEGTASYSAALYYQSTSREYIEFLRDQIKGNASTLKLDPVTGKTPSGESASYIVQTDTTGFFNNLKGWGDAIHDLWVHNNGAAPIMMAEVGAKPTPETPLTVDPPTGTKVSYNTRQKTVTVSWTAPATGANGYNVYRSLTSGGPYTKIGSAAGGPTSFADSTVVSGNTYYYVVTTYKTDKLGTVYESGYSNQASIRIK